MARVLTRAALPTAQIAFVALLVGLWYQGSSAGWLDQFVFGSPSATWSQLTSWAGDGTIAASTLATLRVLLLGWGIGMAVGIAFGVALGSSRALRRIFDPYLAFFNGMPRLILYPFLAIWLGFGLSSKLVFVALVIFVLVTTVVIAGFDEVDRDVVQNMQVLGAGRTALLKEVYGPSLAIWIISSARVTMGYAFQAAIAAEFVGATSGLGYLAQVGSQRLDVNQVWAALIVLVVIAFVLDGVIALVDRRVLRWMPAPPG
jgi:ABC-type nitrate/sulfonate/bicarbonate transport system permease component